jgi:GT2 family glycosyltransferase
MTTAVVKYELEKWPASIEGLAGFDQAFILLCLHGQVAGGFFAPLKAGTVSSQELGKAAHNVDFKSLRRRWLATHLGLEAPHMREAAPKGSVAVCTRDRPEDLRRCLASLAEMPDDGQEIICVDSASSTGETARVAAEFPRVRYLRCDLPGLDRARNLALRAAVHPVVAFCDDDVQVDPGWLRALLRNYTDPHVQCVTGLVLPRELATPAQEAFERFTPFQRGFTRKEFHFQNLDPLLAGHVGAGASMSVRRSVIAITGGFDEALDAGTPTCSGGDFDFFYRVLRRGYTIVYEPAALSWHEHRKAWRELLAQYQGYGVGISALWTRQLARDHEWGVLRRAFEYICFTRLPAVIQSFLRLPGSAPLDLSLAELRGFLQGSRAYQASRRQTAGAPGASR